MRTSLSSWLHSRKVDCRDSARFWPGVINPRHLCPYQCGGSKSDSKRIRILPELKNLQVLKHCNFFLPKKSRKHENTTFAQLKKPMNNVNKNIKRYGTGTGINVSLFILILVPRKIQCCHQHILEGSEFFSILIQTNIWELAIRIFLLSYTF